MSEEKMREEAEEAFKIRGLNRGLHSLHDFVMGYLAACRKMEKEIEGLKKEIRLLKDGLIPKPEYRKLVFRKETKTIWEVNQKGEYLHNTGIRAEETK